MGMVAAVFVPTVVGSSIAAPASAAATSSVGCGTASPPTTTLTPTVKGVRRVIIVHRPTRATDTTPLALVLNLHGSGSTALEQEEFTGMNKTANVDEFIVAYPQALIPDGTGFDWNVPGEPLIGGRSVPAKAANDITFLTTVVQILEHRYCVDPSRVYATGFSGGAREASQLACDASGVVAAVAPVSGLRRPLPCPTTRAVPILTIHGSADPVDPFAGHGQNYWTYSVATAAKDWATQDHCALRPSRSEALANVKLTTYAHCAGGATVKLYEIDGEGHEWPGGPTLPSSLTALLGPQSDAVDANALMWSFFQAHPLS